MTRSDRNGFTLIEVLIVVVILAALIIPQFTIATSVARENTAVFNLNTLRAEIELYKAQHGGAIPNPLTRLTEKTNSAGTTSTGDGTLEFGPYMEAIPENTMNTADTVATITTATVAASDLTSNNAGGWVYSTNSGGIWLDHDTLYTE